MTGAVAGYEAIGRADRGIKRLPPWADICYSPQHTEGNHNVHPQAQCVIQSTQIVRPSTD
jgi:hypothetical protein